MGLPAPVRGHPDLPEGRSDRRTRRKNSGLERHAVKVHPAPFPVGLPETLIGYLTAPVPRGQPAFFYATGLGAMTPPVADGSGGDETPVVAHIAVKPTVLIGNNPAQVDFAGQAPGYPGVNQVNIVIPQSAPAGNSVPLQVRTADGSVISTSGATIAVR